MHIAKGLPPLHETIHHIIEKNEVHEASSFDPRAPGSWLGSSKSYKGAGQRLSMKMTVLNPFHEKTLEKLKDSRPENVFLRLTFGEAIWYYI
jgi:hypothetical protein